MSKFFTKIEKLFEENICNNKNDILPCKNEIDKLVEGNKENIVSVLKSLETRFDNFQLGFKILANALYGATGMKSYRFFNLSIAEAITLTGQEESNTVINRLLQFGYSIIYSDTDSCFIDVKEINEVKDKLTKNIKISEKDNPIEFEKEYRKEAVKWIYNEYVPEINKISNDILNKLAYIQGIKSPEYGNTHFYHFKQEIVARSGIFIPSRRGDEAKKRYTLYLIDQEGVEKNEITCAGCPLKQSAYPQFVVDKFKEFAELILVKKFTEYRNLSNKEFSDKIYEFLFEYREQIITLCNNWNLEIIGTYKQITKPFEEYKSLTSVVKFAKYWNETLSEVIKFPKFLIKTRYIAIPVKLKSKHYINNIFKNPTKFNLNDIELKFLKLLVNFVQNNDINEILIVDETDTNIIRLLQLIFDIDVNKYLELYLHNVYESYLRVLGLDIKKVMKNIKKDIQDLI